jgi:hypothetical protein
MTVDFTRLLPPNTLGGSARSMEFKYGLSNERESSTNRAVALMAEDFPRRPM